MPGAVRRLARRRACPAGPAASTWWSCWRPTASDAGQRLGGRRGGPPRLPGRRRLPADSTGRRARRRAAGASILPDLEPRPAGDRGRDARATSTGSRSARSADAEQVAEALDDVAIACSPHRDLAVNPAKMLAIALADTNPVVWGGSVLAARAARRVAESIRRASGRTALAGDAEHLLPVIEAARPRDVFDDPFADDARRAPADAAGARRRQRGAPWSASSAAGSRRRPTRAAYGSRGLTTRRAHRGRPLRLPLPQRHLRRGVPADSASSRTRRRPDLGRGRSCPRRHDETALPAAKPRDPWLDNAKMALVTLVVDRARLDAAAETGRDRHLYDFLYAWHVPAFVFVTGYLSRSLHVGRRCGCGSWCAPSSCRTSSSSRARAVPDLRRRRAARGPVPGPALADVVPRRAVLLAAADPVFRPMWGGVVVAVGDQPGRRAVRRGHPRPGPGPGPAAVLRDGPQGHSRAARAAAPPAAQVAGGRSCWRRSVVLVVLDRRLGQHRVALLPRALRRAGHAATCTRSLTRAFLLAVGTLGASAFLALVPRVGGWFTRMGAVDAGRLPVPRVRREGRRVRRLHRAGPTTTRSRSLWSSTTVAAVAAGAAARLDAGGAAAHATGRPARRTPSAGSAVSCARARSEADAGRAAGRARRLSTSGHRLAFARMAGGLLRAARRRRRAGPAGRGLGRRRRRRRRPRQREGRRRGRRRHRGHPAVRPRRRRRPRAADHQADRDRARCATSCCSSSRRRCCSASSCRGCSRRS